MEECIPEAWHGSEFVEALNTWLKHGFILDTSDEEVDEAGETETIAALGERNRIWLEAQCTTLNTQLRYKFFWYREENDKQNLELRKEALKEADNMMKGFKVQALSRMVESGVFWKHPGKGATMVESQSQRATQRCQETLDQTRRHMEDYFARRQSAQHKQPAEEPTKPKSVSALEGVSVCIPSPPAPHSPCSPPSLHPSLFVSPPYSSCLHHTLVEETALPAFCSTCTLTRPCRLPPSSNPAGSDRRNSG